MEAVLVWQLSVVISIAIARLFSANAMIWAAVGWTIFTFMAVWANGLVFLQFGSAWGTVWLLSSIFSKGVSSEKKIPESRGGLPEEVYSNWAACRPEPVVVSSEVASKFPASMIHQAEEALKPIGRVSSFLSSVDLKLSDYNEKQRANRDLLYQLRLLRVTISGALALGENRAKKEREISEDPQLAEIYLRVRANFDRIESEHPREPDRKLDLIGVAAMPVEVGSLPPEAAKERIHKLEETLRILHETRAKVNCSPGLLAGIDENHNVPFLPFLNAQIDLLEDHRRLLRSPTEEKDTGAVPGAPVKKFDVVGLRKQAFGKPANTTISFPSRKPSAVAQPADVISGQRAVEIEEIVRELRIPHLTHFTRCENLLNILQRGLLSVEACAIHGVDPTRNDQSRFDGQLGATSLSIAFPNYRMFWKYRQLAPEADWAVLLISPKVLFQKDCAFYALNAADARMIRRPVDQMKSAQALRDVFASDGEHRDDWLRPYDPTDPQAEVLVYNAIEPRLIEAIAFETAEAHARHSPYLAEHESFYAGHRRGLFGSRRHVRTA